jgi:prepilin-type N-terminal cleavage/methylation domain-containing protein
MNKFWNFQFSIFNFQFKLRLQRGNLRGFTLLEMMVVVVILSMLVSGAYIAFKSGGDAWSGSEARMQRYQNARCVLEQMRTEISSLYFHASDDPDQDYRCRGSSSNFYFYTRLEPPENPEPEDEGIDLYLIGYSVYGNELKRYCEIGPSPPIPGSLGGGSSFADHITSIEFKYWEKGSTTGWGDGGYAETAWPDTKDYPPRAVLITIKVVDDITSYEQTFSTAIYIP